MTPFAHRIVKHSLTGDVYAYTGEGWANVRFHKIQCFEVSEIIEAAKILFLDTKVLNSKESTILPASPCWIEFDWMGVPKGSNIFVRKAAFLYTTNADTKDIACLFFREFIRDGALCADMGMSRLGPMSDRVEAGSIDALGRSILAIINTPKHFARETHAPHKGLAREAKRAGLGELRPWTEVKLRVLDHGEPGGEGRDGALTGGKALHFVRSFMRLRLGRIEIVRPHWRGDPALGVVQKTYKVTP